jgi:hypothetical protein
MYYRRDHTFDVKTCFQQTRYVFITFIFKAKIASQISKRHLSAWKIWTFFRRFSRNLTPRETPKKYFNSICVTMVCRHVTVIYKCKIKMK